MPRKTRDNPRFNWVADPDVLKRLRNVSEELGETMSDCVDMACRLWFTTLAPYLEKDSQ